MRTDTGGEAGGSGGRRSSDSSFGDPAITPRAARLMKGHLYGIPRYAEHRYTNAKSEGMNSRIQLLKHRARGYRNRENFRNAILFHCGGLDMNPR